MILSHFNLQPIAFVKKATQFDVLLRLCCELAIDACLRFWRTVPLVPGDCLHLKRSIRTTNPESLAFDFCCGDALCVFNFKTGTITFTLLFLARD
jgi:hypothetical protein